VGFRQGPFPLTNRCGRAAGIMSDKPFAGGKGAPVESNLARRVQKVAPTRGLSDRLHKRRPGAPEGALSTGSVRTLWAHFADSMGATRVYPQDSAGAP
jgi:hypothetical protein